MQKLLNEWRAYIRENKKIQEKIDDENSLTIEKVDQIADDFGVERVKRLGHGAFGVVYEVLDPKTGQKLALKIPNGYEDDNENEIKAYKAISKVRNKFGKYKKHLPVVHKITDEAILMELLEPVPPSVLFPAFSSGPDRRSDSKIPKILSSEAGIRKILKFIQYEYENGGLGFVYGLDDDKFKEINDKIKTLGKRNFIDRVLWHYNKPKVENILKIDPYFFILKYEKMGVLAKMNDLANSIAFAMADIAGSEVLEDERIRSRVKNSIRTALTNSFEANLFSINYLPKTSPYYDREMDRQKRYSDKRGVFQTAKDAKEIAPEYYNFMKAIEAFKRRGISVRDMHSGNVMVRPTTGDIVIVDLGLFEIDRPESPNKENLL
jgi:serine/threonine protein kinase